MVLATVLLFAIEYFTFCGMHVYMCECEGVYTHDWVCGDQISRLVPFSISHHSYFLRLALWLNLELTILLGLLTSELLGFSCLLLPSKRIPGEDSVDSNSGPHVCLSDFPAPFYYYLFYYLCLCTTCMLGAQCGLMDSLVLELQMAVSHHVDARNLTQGLFKATNAGKN